MRIVQVDVDSWSYAYTRLGIWYWMYPLPNGWTAMVIDDSPVRIPARPTLYRIAAASKVKFCEQPREYDTLREAKDAALFFAASKPRVEEG